MSGNIESHEGAEETNNAPMSMQDVMAIIANGGTPIEQEDQEAEPEKVTDILRTRQCNAHQVAANPEIRGDIVKMGSQARMDFESTFNTMVSNIPGIACSVLGATAKEMLTSLIKYSRDTIAEFKRKQTPDNEQEEQIEEIKHSIKVLEILMRQSEEKLRVSLLEEEMYNALNNSSIIEHLRKSATQLESASWVASKCTGNGINNNIDLLREMNTSPFGRISGADESNREWEKKMQLPHKIQHQLRWMLKKETQELPQQISREIIERVGNEICLHENMKGQELYDEMKRDEKFMLELVKEKVSKHSLTSIERLAQFVRVGYQLLLASSNAKMLISDESENGQLIQAAMQEFNGANSSVQASDLLVERVHSPREQWGILCNAMYQVGHKIDSKYKKGQSAKRDTPGDAYSDSKKSRVSDGPSGSNHDIEKERTPTKAPENLRQKGPTAANPIARTAIVHGSSRKGSVLIAADNSPGGSSRSISSLTSESTENSSAVKSGQSGKSNRSDKSGNHSSSGGARGGHRDANERGGGRGGTPWNANANAKGPITGSASLSLSAMKPLANGASLALKSNFTEVPRDVCRDLMKYGYCTTSRPCKLRAIGQSAFEKVPKCAYYNNPARCQRPYCTLKHLGWTTAMKPSQFTICNHGRQRLWILQQEENMAAQQSSLRAWKLSDNGRDALGGRGLTPDGEKPIVRSSNSYARSISTSSGDGVDNGSSKRGGNSRKSGGGQRALEAECSEVDDGQTKKGRSDSHKRTKQEDGETQFHENKSIKVQVKDGEAESAAVAVSNTDQASMHQLPNGRGASEEHSANDMQLSARGKDKTSTPENSVDGDGLRIRSCAAPKRGKTEGDGWTRVKANNNQWATTLDMCLCPTDNAMLTRVRGAGGRSITGETGTTSHPTIMLEEGNQLVLIATVSSEEGEATLCTGKMVVEQLMGTAMMAIFLQESGAELVEVHFTGKGELHSQPHDLRTRDNVSTRISLHECHEDMKMSAAGAIESTSRGTHRGEITIGRWNDAKLRPMYRSWLKANLECIGQDVASDAGTDANGARLGVTEPQASASESGCTEEVTSVKEKDNPDAKKGEAAPDGPSL
jgi:hypothetical protein